MEEKAFSLMLILLYGRMSYDSKQGVMRRTGPY